MKTIDMEKVHWKHVPLFWLDTARPLTEDERLTALAEYRRTGGMYLVVMAEPDGSESPEDADRVSSAGVEPDMIDWSGFDQRGAS